MSQLSPEDVLIRMWPTPNPYALKFTFNVPIKSTGKATFHSAEECSDLPLVTSLFSIAGTKRIYLFQNQITLTHDGSTPPEEIEKQLTSIIRTRISIHDPDFSHEETANPLQKRSASNDPQIMKVDEILDRTIRPGLQADGGDLEVVSVDGDRIQISYQGACGGCPSATTGTLEAIENILRHELGKPNLNVIPV